MIIKLSVLSNHTDLVLAAQQVVLGEVILLFGQTLEDFESHVGSEYFVNKMRRIKAFCFFISELHLTDESVFKDKVDTDVLELVELLNVFDLNNFDSWS